MFSRSEVIVRTNKQTNKQTPLKTFTSLRYATPVGNDLSLFSRFDRTLACNGQTDRQTRGYIASTALE